MIKKIIARNIGYPLYDIITGCRTLRILKFLNESQWWSSEKIKEFQLLKLKKLIDHCYKNVPFYHDLFKKIGITSDNIKKIEDIDKIPILTKKVVRNQGFRMISNIHDKKSLIYSSTGGTTGAPLNLVKDNHTKSWVWALFYRFFNWMDFDFGDPRVIIWGQKIVPKKIKRQIQENINNWLKNDYFINAFNISNNRMSDYIEKINKIKPINIHGYCTSVYNFALLIEKYGIFNNRIKAISTTAEVLQQFHRKKFEEVFGCKVFNQYGCGETNSIAFECNVHQGLHINSEHVIFELSKDKNNINNGSGQVIITDLDNYAMPFLRYQNGDISTLDKKLCSCGRELPLIKSIKGRQGDTIYSSDGTALHPEFFTHLLKESGFYDNYNVVKYQVVQESINKLIWNFVIDKKLKIRDKKILMRYIKEYLPKMQVEFNIHDRIPNEKSGKFKYVKSKINKKGFFLI